MTYPKKVRIVEVGPRDGFQNIKDWIDTDVKIRAIEMLQDSGVDLLEATSFISPKAVPQMRDASEIAASLYKSYRLDNVYALIGNKRGADDAVKGKLKAATFVISASETHNLGNVRRTPAQSLEQLKEIRETYPDLHIKLDAATAFGCPFIGEVPYEAVRFVIDGATALGVKDVCLCDTIGVASPKQIKELLPRLIDRYAKDGIEWSLHLHNTRGMAAVNAMAAMEFGVDRFETAAAGLGGCPFAPGASGNMATEDMLYLLRELGISCDADINGIIAASDYIIANTSGKADRKIDAVTINKIFEKKCEQCQ